MIKKSRKYYDKYITIILMNIFLGTLHANEKLSINSHYVKDPRQSNDVVRQPIRKNVEEKVLNVLSCLGNNNKLFVCYSGYGETLSWEYSKGHRTNPVQKKTNPLTEIDLLTKIEKKFDTPSEIDMVYLFS